ncbi:hypothetical protein [uncultured Eubacterium sp.]|uniref:hypothetical protein n=1 Tax=uncultured Eubacterium sp. TaxID=165185 RepID=UPI0025D4CE6F|nr:hypothetical protein [uncultured Eubacterium sp.]
MNSKKDYKKVQDSRIVSVTELLLELFRRIKLILLAAVVFAVALGGYKYIKDKKSADISPTAVSVEEAGKSLTEEELEQVRLAEYTQTSLEKKQEYAEKSVLMQLDPYNVSTASIQFLIGTDNNEQLADLKYAYYMYVNDGQLLEDLEASGVKEETQYLNEIISYEDASVNNGNSTTGNMVTTNTGSTFGVKVKYTDKESCENLADSIISCISDYAKTLSGKMYTHTITMVNCSYSNMVDSSVAQKQSDCMTAITTLKDQTKQLTEQLSTTQKIVLEKESQEASSDEDKAAVVTKVSISKKYIGLGGAIGIVLAVLYIMIAYLLRGTINSSNDIKYLYNSRVLAEIPVSGKNVLYRKVRKILLKDSASNDRESALKLLVSNVKYECEKNDIHEMIMAYACEDKYMQTWVGEAEQQLQEAGIKLCKVSGGLEQAQAVEEMSRLKNIVLVEKLSGARYETITREMEICMEYNMDLMGIVALN